MPNIAILNSQKHRGLRVHAGSSVAASHRHFVQIVVREFSIVAVRCPILFSKEADTGQFFVGAMLGFEEGENLFLNDPDGYRPLNLQRGPFYVSGEELAIDIEDPRVGTEKGEPLFTEDGEPTPYTQSMLGLFRELRPGVAMTKLFIDKLMELRLIEPIDISLALDDGVTRHLEGLYSINQDALRSLPDETVLDLFRRNYLQLIYLIIASLKQVPILAQRKNRGLLPSAEALAGPAG